MLDSVRHYFSDRLAVINNFPELYFGKTKIRISPSDRVMLMNDFLRSVAKLNQAILLLWNTDPPKLKTDGSVDWDASLPRLAVVSVPRPARDSKSPPAPAEGAMIPHHLPLYLWKEFAARLNDSRISDS